jgi:hypothetical protein
MSTLPLTAGYWGIYYYYASAFVIPDAFKILLDPTSDVRPFLTDADQVCAVLSVMLCGYPHAHTQMCTMMSTHNHRCFKYDTSTACPYAHVAAGHQVCDSDLFNLHLH